MTQKGGEAVRSATLATAWLFVTDCCEYITESYDSSKLLRGSYDLFTCYYTISYEYYDSLLVFGKIIYKNPANLYHHSTTTQRQHGMSEKQIAGLQLYQQCSAIELLLRPVQNEEEAHQLPDALYFSTDADEAFSS